MILMRANLLLGPLEGVGPENQTFLGPDRQRAERVRFGPEKVKIFRAHPPSNGPIITSHAI